MHASTGWIFFALAAGLQYVHCSTDDDALFMTPYIEACNYSEAREKSKVDFFKTVKEDVTAYSGYITVDNSTKSHLFFLLTEVQGNSSTAPLLLWTQGGPGLSALFGLFLENGPVGFAGFDEKMMPQFFPRTHTLQDKMSILYLDLPVGAGFSFTATQTAYPKRLEDVVDHVMVFLEQFLKVFTEYNGRHFYLAGESYGARYSVAVAHRMLQEPEKIPLNLAGVIGGNGFLGPVFETADSSDFLYQVSMLTTTGHTSFSNHFQNMRNLLPFAAMNETITAHLVQMLFSTIFTNTPPTLFQNLTSYNDHASPFYTERPLHMVMCYMFLNNSSNFKKAIHVGGNADFQYLNKGLLYTFASDWLRNITDLTKEVLEGTRVLLYLGQMDALFPSVQQRAYIASIEWSRAQAYRDAIRNTWTPREWAPWRGFAGYTKKVTNFTEAVVLNMSHYGAAEKPEEAYYLVTEFVNDSHNEVQ